MIKFRYCSMCGKGFQVPKTPIWCDGETFLCRCCAMEKRKMRLDKARGVNVR